MITRHVPCLAAVSAVLLAAGVAAQDTPRPEPSLSMEQRTALRCSAAFAIVSTLQARGEATEYPALGKRGREFFVRSAARIMDEAGLTRADLGAAMQGEALALSSDGALERTMPACLLLLDASGV